jgi:hypothetical protein
MTRSPRPLTEQQTAALAMLAEGASSTDIVRAGVVADRSTIRRWRRNSDAFKRAELELYGPMADHVSALGHDARERLAELMDDTDSRIALQAASKLADLDAKTTPVTERGKAAQAAVIVVSPADIAAAFERRAVTPADIEPSPVERPETGIPYPTLPASSA